MTAEGCVCTPLVRWSWANAACATRTGRMQLGSLHASEPAVVGAQHLLLPWHSCRVAGLGLHQWGLRRRQSPLTLQEGLGENRGCGPQQWCQGWASG